MMNRSAIILFSCMASVLALKVSKPTRARTDHVSHAGLAAYDAPAQQSLETPAVYSVKLLDFNFQGMDFSPYPYRDGLVFVSARAQKGSEVAEMPFLTLYYTEEQEDGSFLKPTPFNTSNISAYHEGPCAFYQDETRQIFTRNSFIKKSKSKNGDPDPLELAYAERTPAGKWSSPITLPLAPAGYSAAHPAVSKDGTILYFSSDRPGTLGQSDIFFTKLENDKWSEPKNLGASVNTGGQELFPFLYKDSLLFFSSNGRTGMGGLDLFYVNIKSKDGRVHHLPQPLNSSADDFGIYVEDPGSSGFFSSNRLGGIGEDDIYYFEEIQPVAHVQFYDSVTRHPAPNVDLIFSDGYNTPVKRRSDLAGNVEVRLRPLRQHSLFVADDLYHAKSVELSSGNVQAGRSSPMRVYLRPKSYLPETITAGLQTHDRANITNVISFTSGPLDVDVVSESAGPNNQETPDYKADVSRLPSLNLVVVEIINDLPSVYIVQGDSIHPFNKVTSSLIQNDMYNLRLNIPQGAKRQVYETIMREQLLAQGYGISRFLLIRSFFFDSGKSWVRNDACAQLDKIIDVMVNHPEVRVEMTFHSDSRGTERYNLDLSKQRAEEVAAYLLKSGIGKNRIVARFVGEGQLLNDCGNLADCDELLHQINRTAEFRFLLD